MEQLAETFACIWRIAIQSDEPFNKSPGFLDFWQRMKWFTPTSALRYDETTKQFSTAREAEYPRPLSEEYTRVLKDIAAANNLHVMAFPKATEATRRAISAPIHP